MTTFYPQAEARFFSHEGSYTIKCTVKIQGALIFVVCGDGGLSFKGVMDKNSGNYELRSDESDALAFLRHANPSRLEGSTFDATTVEGMWRIKLGEPKSP